MRTTLTLDDDNAAAIERLRSRCGMGFKDLVNEALRRGLKEMEEASKRPEGAYRMNPVDLGRCRLESLDDVAAALAAGESEGFG